MITGLPLQNKLMTYKKRRKQQRQSFFQSVGLGPPPPNSTKISWIRADIRYRGGIETIKTFYSAAKI